MPYLLGVIDDEQLETSLSVTTNEILSDRWRCQADFYIALRALRERNRSLFQGRLKSCADSRQGLLEYEYHLASWEVRQGFPELAFTS